MTEATAGVVVQDSDVYTGRVPRLNNYLYGGPRTVHSDGRSNLVIELTT